MAKTKKKTKKLGRRKKKQDPQKNREVCAFFLAIATFITTFAFVNSKATGIIGDAFVKVMISIFGYASYLIPVFLFWFFVQHLRKSIELKNRADFIWSLLSLICATIICEASKTIFGAKITGGWIGENLFNFFSSLIALWPTFIILSLAFIYFFTRLLRMSITNTISLFISSFKKDENEEEEEQYEEIKPKSKKNRKEFIEESEDEPALPNIVSRKEKIEEVKNFEEKPQEKIDSTSFDYKLPPVSLLKKEENVSFDTNKEELFKRAELLRKTLADFGIQAEVKDIIPGPVLTRYDLVLAPGIKIQSVSNIIDNISLTMKTSSIRIVPIPEKSAVGVEVPNPKSVIVGLRAILESTKFKKSNSLLTLALGKMTDGQGYITKLSSMPHLLIAGATGSGKSVGIHTIILSILFKARPDEVKFMLIDPKRVEMPVYSDLPHIYNPSVQASQADIITNPREASLALKKLVNVMEERYSKFAKVMVRNIEEYNAKMAQTGGQKEFYIVVIIDELADLMIVAPKEIEDSIQRLAQMARAVGIHLILATQRPSVNVITGVIKANFPARMSFQTTSKIDSRVILDMLGAEGLMGKGDMLFLPPGEARPVRLQGAFVSTKEIQDVISFIVEQNFPRVYEPLTVEVDASSGFNAIEEKSKRDLIPALKLIEERKRVSQDLLKANFGSSARATNILSILEMKEFIFKPEGTNKWQINYEKIRQYLESNQQ